MFVHIKMGSTYIIKYNILTFLHMNGVDRERMSGVMNEYCLVCIFLTKVRCKSKQQMREGSKLAIPSTWYPIHCTSRFSSSLLFLHLLSTHIEAALSYTRRIESDNARRSKLARV